MKRAERTNAVTELRRAKDTLNACLRKDQEQNNRVELAACTPAAVP
ncbi:MAG: hypothetical protein WA005_11875 [Candidatus Binataceae bacterium]